MQSVKHVMEEFRWGSGARSEYKEGSGERVKINDLLYKKEGWIGHVKFGTNLLKGGRDGLRRGEKTVKL